jgi:hypothetical protein
MASELAVLREGDLLLGVREVDAGVSLVLYVKIFVEVDSEVVRTEVELVFAQWKRNVEVRGVHVEVCRVVMMFQSREVRMRICPVDLPLFDHLLRDVSGIEMEVAVVINPLSLSEGVKLTLVVRLLLVGMVDVGLEVFVLDVLAVRSSRPASVFEVWVQSEPEPK